MKYLALVFSSLTLVACGGGGSYGDGSGTPGATLNSANQIIAAQDTASTAFMPLLGTQTLTGAKTQDESLLFGMARSQLNKLPGYIADAKAASTLTGVVQNRYINCLYGGTLTVAVYDPDNNGVISAGDTVTVTGNNCMEAEGTVHGTLSFGINSVTGNFGSAFYSAGMVMRFTDFSLANSLFSATANGDLNLSISSNGVHTTSVAISTPYLSVSGSYAGYLRSRTLTSYAAVMNQTPDPVYGYVNSYTLNGYLTSSALGSQTVSFATAAPFVSYGNDYYPSSGALVIIGGGNTAVRLTADTSSQVWLDLDANGDNFYELETLVNWNSLM